jgi:LacI family transcriptional regulator
MGITAVEVLAQHGLRVPADVSVVGFGDAPEAEAAGLTTVAADIVEQGRRTARQLISQQQGTRITGVTVLSVRLVIRQTCGCSPL